ncbi:unnamed protein product [Penicillium pancosmium]
MEDPNLNGLATKLNGLLERVGEILTKLEALLPVHEQVEFVKNLPVPAASAISRLRMLGRTPPDEQINHPTEGSHHAPFEDLRVDTVQLTDRREDSELPIDERRQASIPNDRGGNDSPLDDSRLALVSLDHPEQDTARGSGDERVTVPPVIDNPDRRSGLYRHLTIPDYLHKVLMENDGDPQRFLRSVSGSGGEGSSGLTGAFFRLQQKCQDIQDDETRELYLQFHSLHQRLELRNIFLLAKHYGYHNGERWNRNACQQLAAQIKSKNPSLNTDSLLEEYVRLGCAYNKWAEALCGPGTLLILPLSVTEYQYTEEKGLDKLGQKICTGLWTAAYGTEITERPATKSTLRNKRKRQQRDKKVGTPLQEDNLGLQTSTGSECSSMAVRLDARSIESTSERPPKVATSFIPTGVPGYPGPVDITSLFPGGDAQFPDPIDITSLLPGGDAEFPGPVDITSLFPGGDAEFPGPVDITSLFPGGDAEFPDPIDITSLLPGGDAEFPGPIDITSLLPGGDAEFPDAIDEMAFLSRGGGIAPSHPPILATTACPSENPLSLNDLV